MADAAEARVVAVLALLPTPPPVASSSPAGSSEGFTKPGVGTFIQNPSAALDRDHEAPSAPFPSYVIRSSSVWPSLSTSVSPPLTILPDNWLTRNTAPALIVVPDGTVARIDPLARATTTPPAETSWSETLANSTHSLPVSVPIGFGRNSLIRSSPGNGVTTGAVEGLGLTPGVGEAATAVPGVASTSTLAINK